MIPIEIRHVKFIQSSVIAALNKQAKNALDALEDIKTQGLIQTEIDYLNLVKAAFQNSQILIAEPHELDQFVRTVGKVPLRPDQTKPLKNLIIEALNYKGLRSSFYPGYFRKLGIKACVYCNSQLTVTIPKKKYKLGARFDVDHHLPKDDFPFLAISLFNLYPVCASCNRAKGTNTIGFQLYKYNPSIKSVYRFRLDRTAKSRYLTNFDSDVIEFKFHEPPLTAQQMTSGTKSLQELFYIQEIHDTQKDLVGELILKSLVYNESNKEQLRRSFNKLSMSDKLFEQMIVGNYVNEPEIHKRPFSKLIMDIARDLKIIV